MTSTGTFRTSSASSELEGSSATGYEATDCSQNKALTESEVQSERPDSTHLQPSQVGGQKQTELENGVLEKLATLLAIGPQTGTDRYKEQVFAKHKKSYADGAVILILDLQTDIGDLVTLKNYNTLSQPFDDCLTRSAQALRPQSYAQLKRKGQEIRLHLTNAVDLIPDFTKKVERASPRIKEGIDDLCIYLTELGCIAQMYMSRREWNWI